MTPAFSRSLGGDVVDKSARGDPERGSEAEHSGDARVSEPAFDPADLSDVDAGCVCNGFLGKSSCGAGFAHVRREGCEVDRGDVVTLAYPCVVAQRECHK